MKAKDLKNSILQMAVEGKLVPQDPADEPESVLLERIREEKQRLIAEGKAKFPKGGESVIYTGSDGSPYEKRVDAKGRVLSEKHIADEVPFEKLPEGWAWARLSGVASIQLGKMLDRQKNEGELVPYLGNANVQWGEFDLANVKTMRMNEADRVKFALAKGDLIVCEGGVPGRCAIWTSNKTMHYQKALHRVRCDRRLLLNTYCELYIRLIVQSHIWDGCFTGTTIKHLPAQTLSSWILPIPPLTEQRRIVERVSALTPLVEEYGKLEDARYELTALLADALQQDARGLVGRILRHQLALHRHLQHGLAQAIGQCGVKLLSVIFQFAVPLDEGDKLVNSLDDATLLGKRRDGKEARLHMLHRHVNHGATSGRLFYA